MGPSICTADQGTVSEIKNTGHGRAVGHGCGFFPRQGDEEQDQDESRHQGQKETRQGRRAEPGRQFSGINPLK